MTLSDIFRLVMQGYSNARTAPFVRHPLAATIRQEGPNLLKDAAGSRGAGLLFAGSAGAGNWAEVPWLAAYDPIVTDTATSGYYVVYLFHSSAPSVHLSLNQGTTVVREEFKGSSRQVLADRAAFMRRRLSDYQGQLSVTEIELGSKAKLPGDYVAGHGMGLTYRLDDLPDEAVLRADFQTALAAYRALTFRGGLDTEVVPEETSDPTGPQSLEEVRRYRLHARIERNSRASNAAKRFHGTRCQACSLDLGERYGSVGSGLIEAHHLRPISSLTEGVQITFDVASDFAVLCPNCHRIIHRMDDPSDIAALRSPVRSG